MKPRGHWRLAILVCLLVVPAGRYQTRAQSGEPHRGPAGDAEHLRYAHVNGVKIAYRAEGAGVPVVFVHGEGYSHELWAKQLDAFASTFLAITYDRRGHGQSEAPRLGYSPLAHAQDLNGLLEHLGIENAHFVVQSRGGVIILQLLRFYPAKVRSLVFADATIPLVNLSDVFRNTLEQRRLDPIPTLEQSLERRENGKRSPFTKIGQATPEVARILERMVNQVSPFIAMSPQRSDFTAATNVGPWNDREFPDMVRLAKPTLVIVGELTDPFFIEGAKAAQRAWPNTRYHMIPGADHLLSLEAPTEFNRVVLDFLATVEAPSPLGSKR